MMGINAVPAVRLRNSDGNRFAGIETAVNSNATPLISLHAVAIDTETTGLDAKSARIIEIAVLQLRGLEVVSDGTLRQLVDPQCPIPVSASQIHGLTEKDLQGAPEFRHVVTALEERIGDAVVVGHNVGYDLAVIDREYARAGLAWTVPRFLDVRALARLADPNLASYDLGALCNWLGVEIIKRHRAFPDALAAAQVFIGLVPRLRSCGIRTLAEAELASRDLPGEERLYQVGGWISPTQALSAVAAPAIAAVDSYPYRHRVRDVASRVPVFADLATDVREAARRLVDGSPGGMVIVKPADGPAGFVTAADLLQVAMAAHDSPSTLRDIALRPLPSIAEDDFLYRALGRMCRLDVQHLGVVNRTGEIVGTLSAADLLRHRVTSALALGDEIDAARTVGDLGLAWAKVPNVVASSLGEAIEPPDIAGIISAEIRALTARAACMAEERMRAGGKGDPPCAYAVLVLGSAGRGDSLMSADQDNAIVYATGEPDGAEDLWFAEMGTYIADILHEVGIPYCPGGVMAKNPGCRHSETIWKNVIADWISRSRLEDMLAADIFFDGVPVYGDIALANGIFDFAFARAETAPAFIAALASFAKDWYPPLGILGRFALDSDGRLDLKRNGLLPIVTAARTMALKHAIRPTSTLARLSEVKARSLADGEMIDRAMTAYAGIMREVLAQQVQDAHQGIPVSARVHVASMSSGKKAMLKTSMQAINGLIGATLNL
jgi:DNA polymerase-3 subunit epsilon/CBS domain-containing protein